MKPKSFPFLPLLRRPGLIPISYARRALSSSISTSTLRAATTKELRALSATTFAKDEFRDVKWAGVFGSFTRGTQTEKSDVDIVIRRKKLKEKPQPLWFLEELLPKVWNRSVDIIYVRNPWDDFKYDGYVSIEALLCSRTIYGSSRDEEVGGTASTKSYRYADYRRRTFS